MLQVTGVSLQFGSKKLFEDVNPEYLAVAFDVKHPTKRHEMYKDYNI